jgi:hypothetical protein
MDMLGTPWFVDIALWLVLVAGIAIVVVPMALYALSIIGWMAEYVLQVVYRQDPSEELEDRARRARWRASQRSRET